MNIRRELWFALLPVLVPISAAGQSQQVGTGFTFQGQLRQDGVPVNGSCDFEFGLWDAAHDPDPFYLLGVQAVGSVQVNNGLFTVQLNRGEEFGPNAFNGDARWLEIQVRSPAGSGTYTTLGPRQAITPAPYALALPGLRTQQHELSPNLIGGSTGNWITPGGHGATVAGGGLENEANRVTDRFGTVGGGSGNQAGDGDAGGDVWNAPYATVAGGQGNSAYAWNATVAGGASNFAGGRRSTVSGGQSNTTFNDGATIGGGYLNSATADFAIVSGGRSNAASGTYSAVPGGQSNTAAGAHSFAAGQQAHANHDGTFVWADTEFDGFASTGPNQFLIRASGGVGIGTNAPGEQLTVDGTIESTWGGFKFPDGTVQTSAASGDGEGWSESGNNIHNTNSGNVGIGTTTPQAKLHVIGTPGADGIMFPDHTIQTTAAAAGCGGLLGDERFEGIMEIAGIPGEDDDLFGGSGYVRILGFTHQVYRQVNPLDPSHTLSERIHTPVSVVKQFDKATPLLYQRLADGGIVTQIQIRWYRQPPEGGGPEYYFTHTFTDCVLISVRPFMSNTVSDTVESFGHLESVTFGYSGVTWTSETGGTQFTDGLSN